MENKTKKHRGRNNAVALAVALATLAVAAAGVEIFLRAHETRILATESSRLDPFLASDPEKLVRYTPKGRRLVPNAHVTIANHNTSHKWVDMRINSLGFRGPDIAVPKTDEFRVLVLGDSITWADYLDEEDTFVRRMAAALPEKVRGKRVEVINAGVGDTGTDEQISILEENGLAAGPDIVLLAFYLNDSRPSYGFAGELAHRGWLRRHSVLAEWLYRNLKLYKFLRREGISRFTWVKAAESKDYMRGREHLLALAEKASFDWGAAWRQDSWPLVESQFARLAALARERGFRVGVISFPVAFQVYPDYVEDAPQRALAGIAGKYGFAYLDLLPVLRPLRGQNLYFDHCHPREATNAVIGEAIAGMVKDKLL